MRPGMQQLIAQWLEQMEEIKRRGMETKVKSEKIRNREWASIYCPGCTEHIGDIGHQTKATLVCLSCGEITYAAVNADGLSILRGGSFDD